MKSHLFLFVAGACLLAHAASAQAQNPYYRPGPTPPGAQPVVSPWLNLLNRGNPALNYFNGVRPQQQFGNSILQLQQGQATTQQELATQAVSSLGQTGHPAYFMSYGQYFQTLGGSTRSSNLPAPRALGATSGQGYGGGYGGGGIGLGRSALNRRGGLY